MFSVYIKAENILLFCRILPGCMKFEAHFDVMSEITTHFLNGFEKFYVKSTSVNTG